MLTLQNDIKDINEYRLKDGFVVTLLKDQCIDLPENRGVELKTEFSFLKIVGATAEEEKPVELPKEFKEEEPKTGDAFVDEITKGQEFPCTICERKFKTHQGMRVHMGKCKAQGDNN